jgi:putative transposase
VILGHAIALDPTPEQAAHFRRACGTARYAYNWGLAEWKRMREVGEKPSANKVKKRWNAHRKAELPWSYDVTKCASGQAIMDLGAAFSNFFRDCKKPKKQRHFRHPKFKRKTLNESFALWNDQFDITGKRVDIAKLGVVKMREELRFLGKIVAATVSFRGGRWFLSVQVETFFCRRPAPEGSVAGIDLGSRTLATVAETDNEDEVEAVPNPKPRERLLGRVRRMQRRIDRQKHRAKRAGQKKGSRRQYIRQLRLSRLQARLANIRKDAAHKLTADRTRRSRTNVIEDLNVAGMAKNHSMAGAILDCGFGEIRRQFQYKAPIRDGRILVANRFFPSTQTCNKCGSVCGPKGQEQMDVERWVCTDCGAAHGRDSNAAVVLRKLGVADAEVTCGDMTPLPVRTRTPVSVADEPRTELSHTCAHI